MTDATKIMPLDASLLPEFVKLTKAYFQENGLVPEFHALDQDLTAPLKTYTPPRGGFWLVRDSQDRAQGMVGVLPIAPRTCEVKRWYVTPDGWRQSMGQALLEHALSFARRAEYLEMLVALRHEYTAALELLQHNGFKPCARFHADQQAGIFLSYKISSQI